MQKLENFTEEQIAEILNRVAGLIAYKFRFSYHEPDDVRQQAIIFGIEALERYRPEKGTLDGFLYHHMRVRTINHIRDTFQRNDPPCKKTCHVGRFCSGQKECDRYLAWRRRNKRKQNVILPIDISNLNDENEKNTRLSDFTAKKFEENELLTLIDEHLPVDLRGYWLRLRAGVSVPRVKKIAVQNFLSKILYDKPRI
jgi:hypothetical protein